MRLSAASSYFYVCPRFSSIFFFFFFNDTATTEIYTLSLHDALPIWHRHFQSETRRRPRIVPASLLVLFAPGRLHHDPSRHGGDRKSTRLNSSHSQISYAVFCLKKKKFYFPCSAVKLYMILVLAADPL